MSENVKNSGDEIENDIYIYYDKIFRLEVLSAMIKLYHYSQKKKPDYVILPSNNFKELLTHKKLIANLLKRIRYDHSPLSDPKSGITQKDREIPEDSIKINLQEKAIISEILSLNPFFMICPLRENNASFKRDYGGLANGMDVYPEKYEFVNIQVTIIVGFRGHFPAFSKIIMRYFDYDLDTIDWNWDWCRSYDRIEKVLYDEIHVKIKEKLRKLISNYA
jgi:hypothetical protein